MVEEAEPLLMGPWDTLGFRLQPSLYNHPAWLGTLSSGAASGCLRASSAVSTFLIHIGIGVLPANWAPLTQSSVSLLGFIIIRIFIFTIIVLASSHFISIHIVSPRELVDLPQLGRFETLHGTLVC